MVLDAMEEGAILARMEHPNKERYPNPSIYVVELNGYVCYVPFMETDDEIFLKTIIPSRKLLKRFKEGEDERS